MHGSKMRHLVQENTYTSTTVTIYISIRRKTCTAQVLLCLKFYSHLLPLVCREHFLHKKHFADHLHLHVCEQFLNDAGQVQTLQHSLPCSCLKHHFPLRHSKMGDTKTLQNETSLAENGFRNNMQHFINQNLKQHLIIFLKAFSHLPVHHVQNKIHYKNAQQEISVYTSQVFYVLI